MADAYVTISCKVRHHVLQRNRAFPNVVHVQSQREDGVFKLRPHEKNESESVARWTEEVVPSEFGASQLR